MRCIFSTFFISVILLFFFCLGQVIGDASQSVAAACSVTFLSCIVITVLCVENHISFSVARATRAHSPNDFYYLNNLNWRKKKRRQMICFVSGVNYLVENEKPKGKWRKKEMHTKAHVMDVRGKYATTNEYEIVFFYFFRATKCTISFSDRLFVLFVLFWIKLEFERVDDDKLMLWLNGSMRARQCLYSI